MNKIVNDHAYMAQALRLAEKGIYTTRKNPRVGCVIVRENEVVGKGFHQYPGQAHAEINALENAKGQTENATVYVSLEPCAHSGKTPPCVEALLAAKISRVVAAMQDPNPLVNGKGLAYLENNGIETDCNILKSEAEELNKGFIQRITTGRPYVTVKSAISLDGKTALQSGESKWISSDESRSDVQKLRARSCAIMTGIDTVLSDDPRLTVRLSNKELGLTQNIQQPTRVVLDTHLRIPIDAHILNSPKEVLIYTVSKDSKKLEKLRAQNIKVVKVEQSDNNVDLNTVMQDLAKHEINEVLVESGSTLVGSLIDKKLVDEMIVYMAPHILGESNKALAKLDFISTMQDRVNFQICQTRIVGQDLKLQLKPQY